MALLCACFTRDDQWAEEEAPFRKCRRAKVLARLFRRDDLAKWERLRACTPLWEHAHDDGQHPELLLPGQEKRKHRDSRVGPDAHRDELGRGVIGSTAALR
jgi:hypothetical protein